mgnify:CR=1 FL=1
MTAPADTDPAALAGRAPFDPVAPGADVLGESLRARASRVSVLDLRGRVTRISGCVLHAQLADGRVGEECILRDPVSRVEMTAEIIGFDGEQAILAPAGDMRGLSGRTEVIPTGREPMVGRHPDHWNVSVLTGGFKVSFGIAHRLARFVVDEIAGSPTIGIPDSFFCRNHIAALRDKSL